MVERIALSAAVLIGMFAVFLGVPRYVTDDGGWPDVIAGMDSIAQRWLGFPRVIDWAVGLLGVVLVGLSVSMFRGADLVAGPEALGWVFLAIGFLALYAGTYVSVRRGGLSSAEAVLISASLVGIVLLVGVLAILLEA